MAFWQARFYDFNVGTTKKRVEKLRYMHRNPVKRGLVQSPGQWRWSSYRFYLLDETGAVRVNEGWSEIRCGLELRNCGALCVRGTRPFGKLRARSCTGRKDGAHAFVGTMQATSKAWPIRPSQI
jgi:hypothetical protein